MFHSIAPGKTHRGRFFAVLRQTAFIFWLCTMSGTSFCLAGGEIDKDKYITIDRIKPGMKGYCLTIYKGTVPEKFELDVIDVVRNIMPGRNAILVQGTDERFIHTGPVAGCSGSPVYINGKLAGALAFGWQFSKDPLYGVTPIEEMLSVGESIAGKAENSSTSGGGFVFDFSKPLNFDKIDEQMTATLKSKNNSFAGATFLPCPLVTSGLSNEACEKLNSSLGVLGFMAVPGLSGQADGDKDSEVKLVPGGCLAVPLVSGDIKIEVIGTATEVVGDKVYGFGHGLLGYGPIDLPMATGRIHTVVASLLRSFKLGSSVNTVGAFHFDESAAVLGRIGAKAKTIPLTIRVDRYNDAQHTYNCRMASNQILTPMIVSTVAGGAAFMRGSFPPEHMIDYDVGIRIKGGETIKFRNVSTALGLMELGKEIGGSVALIMNNPYERPDIESVEFNIRITPKNIVSHIWSVDLSDSKIKAGKDITLDIVVESFLGGKQKYQTFLTVPADLPAGKYDLIVMGGYEYREFLAKTEPYRFVAQSLPNLISAINDFLNIKKDRLYCVLMLPPAGLTVEKAVLPDLPATKAMILSDNKRTLKTQPYPRWVEKDIDTGTIIIDNKVMPIMVER